MIAAQRHMTKAAGHMQSGSAGHPCPRSRVDVRTGKRTAVTDVLPNISPKRAETPEHVHRHRRRTGENLQFLSWRRVGKWFLGTTNRRRVRVSPLAMGAAQTAAIADPEIHIPLLDRFSTLSLLVLFPARSGPPWGALFCFRVPDAFKRPIGRLGSGVLVWGFERQRQGYLK